MTGREREREATNYKTNFPTSIFSLAPALFVTHFILESQAYMLYRVVGMAEQDLALKKKIY